MEKNNISLQIVLLIVMFLAGSINVSFSADFTFDQPVNLVIPYGAGGSHDIHARFLSSVAPEYLDGQPLIVNLKPGGGGAVGSNYVKNAKPDGYTVLFTQPGAHVILPLLENVGYTQDDFEAICNINEGPIIVAVREDSPFDSIEELVEWLKTTDREVIWGTTVIWGMTSLPALILHNSIGVGPFFNFILYDGVAEQIRALLAGELDFAWQILSSTWQGLHEEGRIKILAISSKDRDPRIPDIPTLTEAGYDIQLAMGRYIVVPKGTPNKVKIALTEAFYNITQDPTFKALINQSGEIINYLGPEELETILENDRTIYKKIIEEFYEE